MKLSSTKVDRVRGRQETHQHQPLIQKSVEGGRQSLVRRPSQSAKHKHVDQDYQHDWEIKQEVSRNLDHWTLNTNAKVMPPFWLCSKHRWFGDNLVDIIKIVKLPAVISCDKSLSHSSAAALSWAALTMGLGVAPKIRSWLNSWSWINYFREASKKIVLSL